MLAANWSMIFQKDLWLYRKILSVVCKRKAYRFILFCFYKYLIWRTANLVKVTYFCLCAANRMRQRSAGLMRVKDPLKIPVLRVLFSVLVQMF